VLCDDEATAALLAPDDDRRGIVVVTDRAQQEETVDKVGPTDLFVVPAHTVHDLPPWRMRQRVRQLQDTNIAVVGGPHRLAISQGVTRRPLSAAITPRIATA
jgi:hypothetical protein